MHHFAELFLSFLSSSFSRVAIFSLRWFWMNHNESLEAVGCGHCYGEDRHEFVSDRVHGLSKREQEPSCVILIWSSASETLQTIPSGFSSLGHLAFVPKSSLAMVRPQSLGLRHIEPGPSGFLKGGRLKCRLDTFGFEWRLIVSKEFDRICLVFEVGVSLRALSSQGGWGVFEPACERKQTSSDLCPPQNGQTITRICASADLETSCKVS